MTRVLRYGGGPKILWAGASALLVATTLGAAGLGTRAVASGSGPVTIQFAESGLGTEGAATQSAINAFEKANPNIHVTIDVLSPNSTTYLQQLQNDFLANSSTPDVFESDVTYPAKFAQAGWVLNLTKRFKPNTSVFFKTELKAGTYKGDVYAIPWFDNPEGLYYRTDLVKTPPKTPDQVVSDAEAAMKEDPSLKEGLAFEGEKYEGAITAYVTVETAFGGKLDPTNIDTKANVAALNWLYDAIYKSHIAPQAVTGWQEANVQQAYTSGQTAFAINYPFVFPLANTAGAPVEGHTGYIPFPSAKGTPGSALGGEMLAINAKTAHAAAAYKLIQYLTSPQAEVTRALAAGDPPSLPSAYTPALYAKAPYFKDVKTLNTYAQPRPVSPEYLTISSDLQTTLSSVFSNIATPSQALSQAESTLKTAASGAPGGP
jgi:multiple sugar transport system substrate-binding protein